MNHSPFWPLVWKEYRAGRAFWLSMVVMGLVAQAGVWMLAHPSGDRDWWLYGIALMISAGFAVGIGGTLFAAEHEERTFGLLRVLPLKAKELGGAKLLCALVGLGSLLAALWIAAGAMAGWQSLSARDAGQLCGLWGLACAEGLAWGMLCSLVIRSPLWATVTAVMAVTLSIQAAVTLTKTRDLMDMASYSEAIPLRIALVLAVMAADAWLLPRWLAGRVPQRAEAQRLKQDAGLVDRSPAWQGPAPKWAVQMGRLMWQSWSETAGNAWRLVGLVLASFLVCLGAVVVLLTGILDFGQAHAEPLLVSGLCLFPYFILIPFVVLAVLAGTLTFAVDPTLRARFLAEHGVSPRLVWLSRQIVWGGWLVLLLGVPGVLTVVPRLVPPPNYPQSQMEINWRTSPTTWTRTNFGSDHSYDTQPAIFRMSIDDVAVNAWLFWGVLLTAYSVAQLMSMLFRRRLLAALLALVLGLPAAGWVYLMFGIDIAWWWSALPLAVACLVATWLLAPAWLFGRAAWYRWLAPATLIAGSLIGIGYAVPQYRVDEIPGSRPFEVGSEWSGAMRGYQEDEISAAASAWPTEDQSTASTADVREAIDLYRRAFDLYLTGDNRETRPYRFFDSDAERIIGLLKQATAHPSVWLSDNPATSLRLADRIESLAWSMSSWARRCRERGELAEALANYLLVLRMADHFAQCSPTWEESLRGMPLAGIRSWAAAPGQTAEQIRAAIHRLEEAHAAQPAPTVRVRPWYEARLLAIRDLPAALALGLGKQHVTPWRWLDSRLPWERQRAIRLLDLITHYELGSVDLVGQRMRNDRRLDLDPIFERDWDGGLHLKLNDNGYDFLGRYQGWMSGQSSAEPLGEWLRTTPLIEDASIPFVPMAWLPASAETDYRATLIILALSAWQLDHGQLPETLAELVPGELASLPLDPLLAQPFKYYPHGPAGHEADFGSLHPPVWEVFSRHHEGDGPTGQKPFLWSALDPEPGRLSYTESETPAPGRAYRIAEQKENQP